jgi:hypothetical protein
MNDGAQQALAITEKNLKAAFEHARKLMNAKDINESDATANRRQGRPRLRQGLGYRPAQAAGAAGPEEASLRAHVQRDNSLIGFEQMLQHQRIGFGRAVRDGVLTLQEIGLVAVVDSREVPDSIERSTTERKTPRFNRRRLSFAKNPSTALSQEHEVGVKWKTKRGWRSSQARTLGCL